MIEETVQVTHVEKQKIRVVRSSGGACASCSQTCGTGLVGKALQKPIELQLPIDPGFPDLGPGDKIVLGLPDAGLLQLSMRMYLAPLAGLFLGAVAGAQAGALMGIADTVGAPVGGLSGLAISFLVLRFGCDRAESLRPVILRKLT